MLEEIRNKMGHDAENDIYTYFILKCGKQIYENVNKGINEKFYPPDVIGIVENDTNTDDTSLPEYTKIYFSGQGFLIIEPVVDMKDDEYTLEKELIKD